MAERLAVQFRDRRERVLGRAQIPNPLEGKGPHLRVGRHERHQVEAALRKDDAIRVQEVVLVATAGMRVVSHPDDLVIDDRLEQP